MIHKEYLKMLKGKKYAKTYKSRLYFLVGIRILHTAVTLLALGVPICYVNVLLKICHFLLN